MASVRLTRELRDKLRSEARHLFDKTNKFPMLTPSLSAELADRIKNCSIQNWLETLAKSAEQLKQNSLKLSFITSRKFSFELDKLFKLQKRPATSISLTASTHDEDENNPRLRVEFPHSIDFWCFDNGSYRYDNDKSQHNELFVEELEEDEQDYFNNIIHTQWERQLAYSTKQNEYSSGIDDLINNCTTLHQLLEAWPAAKELVPDRYIQQMHVKVTRATRAKNILDTSKFDQTLANQVILKAKLAGAS